MKKILSFFIFATLMFPSITSVKANYWEERISFSTGTVVDLGVGINSSVLTDGYHYIDVNLQLIYQASGVANYQDTTVEYKLADRFSSSVSFPNMSFKKIENSSTFQYLESWGNVNLSVSLFSVEAMYHEDDHYLYSGWIVIFTISPPPTSDTEGVLSFYFGIIGVAIVGTTIVRKLTKRRRKTSST